MLGYFMAFFWILSANAFADTYNPSTNVLNIDAVNVNGVVFNKVDVKLNAFNVISVGSNQPASTNPIVSIDTYDAQNILFITAVNVNGVQYNNVVIQLIDFSVISVVSNQPITVGDTCNNPFKIAQYNAINVGMTKSQVEQILGCKNQSTNTANNATAHLWNYATSTVRTDVTVFFDTTNGIVTAPFGSIPSENRFKAGLFFGTAG